MNKILLSVVAIALVVGGGSFYGGMKYDQTKSASNRGNFANLTAEQRQAQFAGRGGMMRATGGGLVSGDIISKDAASITVKLRDGGSKIIFYSDITTVGKTIDGTSADLAIGKQVIVTGTTNTDGSVTAQSIQLRPAMPTNQAKP